MTVTYFSKHLFFSDLFGDDFSAPPELVVNNNYPDYNQHDTYLIQQGTKKRQGNVCVCACVCLFLCVCVCFYTLKDGLN